MGRPVSLGKIKWGSKDKNEFVKPEIVKIPFDIHWMANGYIAIIIREYLKEFLKHSPIVPYYGYIHNPYGYTLDEATEKMDGDEAYAIWESALKKSIEDFSALAEEIWEEDFKPYPEVPEGLSGDELNAFYIARRDESLASTRQKIDMAFDGLKEIFYDLEW